MEKNTPTTTTSIHQTPPPPPKKTLVVVDDDDGDGGGGGGGLKFGKKVYFEDHVGPTTTRSNKEGGGHVGSGSKTTPPTGSGQRQQQHQQQKARCQVEGCEVDLSEAKAYYSKHKVCGMHSKSPVVIVAGAEKRFCQQCSRFHQLSEFDQGKRSCRRRLAGHNERRRKPPPGSLASPRHGRLYSSISDSSSRAGGFVMDFSAYSRHNERDPWQSSRSLEQSSPHPSHSWPSSGHNPPSAAANLYGLQRSGGSGSSFPTGQGIPSGECFTGVSVADPNCALSLLSNQQQLPWGSRARAPSTLVVNNFAPHGLDVVQYPNPSWCGSSSLEMHPGTLGQTPKTQPVSTQFSGRQELSQQNTRQYIAELEHTKGYDSPTQHMNWSL